MIFRLHYSPLTSPELCVSSLPHPIPELLAKIKADASPVIHRDGKDVFLARAPGRLDLLGGVANTTGALVCQYPLAIATAVAVQRRDDRMLVLSTYNPQSAQESKTIELSLDDLYGSASLMPVTDVQHSFTGQRHWASYVAGAYYVLAKQRKLTRRVTGANISVYSTIPLGAGVASSAALEIATLSALAAAYHMILEPIELALIGQKIENQIVGAPSGIMDQVTTTLAQADKVLLLTCQPHIVNGFAEVPKGLMLAGIDSGVSHPAAEPSYLKARVAGFMAQAIIAQGYKDLGLKTDPTKGYLANVPPAIYRRYFRHVLPRQINGLEFTQKFGVISDRVTKVDAGTIYAVRAAADHHIAENDRAHQFVDALEQAAVGSQEALLRAGRLLNASHLSNVCRIGLGTAETATLVGLVRKMGPANGFYGTKITGTGGTVAILCDDTPACRERLAVLTQEYAQRSSHTPHLFLASSPGNAVADPTKLPTAELFQAASP
jgi:galactokinase